VSLGKRRGWYALMRAYREVCCWERMGFGFNHKLMFKVQESTPSIKISRKHNGLREFE
jgi:hypothetical protein